MVCESDLHGKCVWLLGLGFLSEVSRLPTEGSSGQRPRVSDAHARTGWAADGAPPGKKTQNEVKGEKERKWMENISILIWTTLEHNVKTHMIILYIIIFCPPGFHMRNYTEFMHGSSKTCTCSFSRPQTTSEIPCNLICISGVPKVENVCAQT